MPGSVISKLVSHTVTLDSGRYASPLTITRAGKVALVTAGATGVYAPAGLTALVLINHGTIDGGLGAKHLHSAGIGVDLASAGIITNGGTIAGGYGNHLVAGGIGVELSAGGTLNNTGRIAGGAAGDGSNNRGSGVRPGGVGVDLTSGGTLTNTGQIVGGAGAGGYYSGGAGGAGAKLAGGILTNTGRILGGAAGNAYGHGIGGIGGNGIDFTRSGNLINQATISAGQGGGSRGGGAGGIGVDLVAGGTLSNTGSVAGGLGGNASLYYNGGAGGCGVQFNVGGMLDNNGSIAGGGGGHAQASYGGQGGAGVVAAEGQAGFTLVNSRQILGGAGGYGRYNGSLGGDGVNLTAGRTLHLTNSGTITGGVGGVVYTTGPGGNGGAGVYFGPNAGGTLTNSGRIAGGAGGYGTSYGAAGDAVQFSTLDATLIVDPGAVFVGAVVADSSARDTLVLAGTTAGTLTGLGTAFRGFTTFTETAQANWLLTGANTLGTTAKLLDAGFLSVSGTLADQGSAAIAAGGTLQASAQGLVQLDILTMSGGTLSEQSGSGTISPTIVIGASAGGAQTGVVTVQSQAEITGYGTITAATLADQGSIVAQGGTLNLLTALSGTGNLTLDQGAGLAAGSTVSVASVVFAHGGNERLFLAAPASVTSIISGFLGSDVIDLTTIKATDLIFYNGTLTVDNGGTTVATLAFKGAYTTANFAIGSDGHTTPRTPALLSDAGVWGGAVAPIFP